MYFACNKNGFKILLKNEKAILHFIDYIHIYLYIAPLRTRKPP